MKKKLFSAILSLALATIMVIAVPISASAIESTSVRGSKISSPVVTGDTTSSVEQPQISTNSFIEPRDNYVVLDQNVSTGGHSWTQPSGYSSYRLYATNTRNEKMQITVSYGSNSYSYDIAANKSITIVVNNAVSGNHDIDFTTPSGSVSGKVTVRVSDTELQLP
ncbi:hypothetical protein [Bacillus sp. FJAT-28004]|uniref:hypothetical protein n=1 Tax=Bacillus sp. FJAT-28004 TaxID=1679165 RepID=UPI000A4A30C8|nr:hypothetical protein [Bacillus sp. FJAT-28004]